MDDQQLPDAQHRPAPFPAEVFLPFDRAKSVTGSVEATATALVVSAAGERFEIAPATTFLALGGHNGERVIVEGEIAAGSGRAGEQVYLQCVEPAFLAHLATQGPQQLHASATRLARKRRAAARRWRLWLTVALIAAAALFAVTLLFFNVLVKQAVSRIPVDWENSLGASLFAAMTAGQPHAPEQEAAVVQAAFARLRAQAPPDGLAFEYAVLENSEVNAFALPGGKFVVFSGLLAQSARPEEVAGVLAHEFQHAVLRHSLQKLVRAAGRKAIFALFVGDLDGVGGLVRDAGLQIRELSYGRDQELEADLAAIDLLARAGIDPTGLPDFLDRIAAKEGAAGGGTGGAALTLLATHPASAKRSAALRTAIVRRGQARYEPLPAPR